jgi:hypothetical protein
MVFAERDTPETHVILTCSHDPPNQPLSPDQPQ